MKNILIIVAVVVLAGIGWFYLKGGKTPTGQDVFTGSLAAAGKLGVPMKCTYTVDEVQYEGYVKGEMYRGQMLGDTGQVDIIIRDNCMYSWGQDGQGTKFCSDPAEGSLFDQPEPSVVPDETTDQGDYTAPDVDYSCLPAVVADSMFEPPADVTFADFGAMMEDLMQPSAEGDQVMDQETLDKMMQDLPDGGY